MSKPVSEQPVRLFSTCPPSSDYQAREYVQRVIDIARWSEQSGCEGILVYADNRLVDPWLAAQIIVQSTERLSPLVAVQPIYMHPYSIAKMVASFGYMYGRRLYLNMVAGGFKNDLEALNDLTPHDQRYDRLTEYTAIIMDLLRAGEVVTRAGSFYKVDHLKMSPPLPAELTPGIFVSGSSEAGLAAAAALDATAVKYPKSAAEEQPLPPTGEWGLRVGIIARPDGEEAWRIARGRFPEDRKGQLTHQLAMKVSDSAWHHELSSRQAEIPDSPYWLVPFQHYKTMCPYLVGSTDVVADEIAGYISLGFRNFILDIPPSLEELRHTSAAFSQAMAAV